MKNQDMNLIHKEYEKFNQLTFPEKPQDIRLLDWILDLAEMDGYYSGIAETVLASHRMEKIEAKGLNEKMAELDTFDLKEEKDKKILNECQIYIRGLISLVSALEGKISQ
ncbi:MAG: hypothetical protein PHR77_04960 [Kiritimatiellae bacterium]|nr:hypothetical protein [Kiritimatiellia bacterium]MDD5522998.1 hypothetical protein [Kiritimatiellia bacterium]